MQAATGIPIDTPTQARAAARALPVKLPALCALCHDLVTDDTRADYRGAPAHRLCALEQRVGDAEEKYDALDKQYTEMAKALKRAKEQTGDALYHAA